MTLETAPLETVPPGNSARTRREAATELVAPSYDPADGAPSIAPGRRRDAYRLVHRWDDPAAYLNADPAGGWIIVGGMRIRGGSGSPATVFGLIP